MKLIQIHVLLSLKNPMKRFCFPKFFVARDSSRLWFLPRIKSAKLNSCRSFLNYDRIIYIDAEVVGSFYAVFQLITFVGFSVDQSKDRQLACVWQNVLKYAVVNNITC